MGKDKRAIAYHKGQLNNHLKELKEELSGLHSEKVNQIEHKIQQIDSYYTEIYTGEDSIKKNVEKVVSKISDYEEKYKSISDYHSDLLEAGRIDEKGSKILTIKDNIDLAWDSIESYKDELIDGVDGEKSIKEKVEKKFKEIKNFYDEVYGTEEKKDSEGNILSEKINGIKKDLEEFGTAKENEFNTLKDKIETLLPGATSAGLSTAYKEMKESFSFPKWFWSACFFFSLLIIVIGGKDINVGVTLEETLLNILPHLTYILPLIWIAYFSSKQQSQNNRLEQEYAHKESLAKSFEGYKEQIDNLGEDEKSKEIKRQLMQSMVLMTGDNPSDTLDKSHGTHPPLWEYMFGSKK